MARAFYEFRIFLESFNHMVKYSSPSHENHHPPHLPLVIGALCAIAAFAGEPSKPYTGSADSRK